MRHSLKYGDQVVTIDLGNDWADRASVISKISPRDASGEEQEEVVRSALDHPVASARLQDLVQPGESVCVVTSDLTRPMPSDVVLPALLEDLFAGGISPDDITVVFATGIHRSQSRAEQVKLVGEDIAHQVRCVDSDPGDVVFVGRTEKGTPVQLTRVVAESDRIICLGNVEFHYFAGYSGGVKAILPGVCNWETVASNHKMMMEPEARAGVIAGNPVREDIDSVLDLVHVDFILNVVLDDQKRIVKAYAGDPIAAHRRAAAYVDAGNRISVRGPGHLVIASTGGYPKDLNLYQAQKALDHAQAFACPGAPIILVAQCSEGYGNRVFAEWLSEADSSQQVLSRLREDFELGGHKAAALARTLRDNPVWLVSDMEPDLVRNAFMKPLELRANRTLQIPEEALHIAEDLSTETDTRVLILPEAASVLPAPVTG